MVADRCPLLSHPPAADLGAIFRDLGQEFLEQERLTPNQIHVFRQIAECRTAALGGALWQCSECGEWVGVYHSCRNRHCPQCEGERRYRWAEARLQELLPVPYFHVVFTLPHELNPLVLYNQKACLNLFFQCVSQTLSAFAKDPKYLGAEPGVILVLHTWGQKLNLHYHIHGMIPAGGYNKLESRWVDPPRKGFLFPVVAMAKVFRGKYLSGLDQLFETGQISFPRNQETTPAEWVAFKRRLARKKRWHVYSKPPFGNPRQLLKYLAQYTNRIALSNSRILSYQNHQVRLRYKDYRKSGYQNRILSLSGRELAHRFLLHVLPPHFVHIRYVGFLSPAKKKKSLEAIRKIGALRGWDFSLIPKTEEVQEMEGHSETPTMEADPTDVQKKCPHCGKPSLIRVRELTLEDKKRARALLWDSS